MLVSLPTAPAPDSYQHAALASRWDELYAAQYPDDDPDDYSPQLSTPEIMQELRDAGYEVVPEPADPEFIAWRRDDFDPWYKEQSAAWAAQDKIVADMLAKCLADDAPAPKPKSKSTWDSGKDFDPLNCNERFKIASAMKMRRIGMPVYPGTVRAYETPHGTAHGTVFVSDPELFGDKAHDHNVRVTSCLSGTAGLIYYEIFAKIVGKSHAEISETGTSHALREWLYSLSDEDRARVWISQADIKAAVQQVRNKTAPAGDWHRLIRFGLHGNGSGPKVESAVWRMAADVVPEQLFWIVDDHLPLGTVVLLSGDTKVGKSQMALHWCACVTAGKDFAEDVHVGKDGRGLAVVVSGEDAIESVVRKRVEAAGCDLSKVVLLEGFKTTKDNGVEIVAPFTLEVAQGVIEDVLSKVPGVKIVVIDPVNAFLGGDCDAYMNNAIRALLNPLVEIAHTHGIMVVLVHHNAKHKQGKSLTSTVGGSNAWVEAVRSVWMVGRVNPDDPAQPECIMEQIAGNNGVQGQRYAYEVQGTTVAHAGVLYDTSRVVVGGHADKSMAEINRGPGKGSKCEDAEDFLQVQLASGGKDAKELEALAKSTGISATTLKRARKRLGVVATKTQGTLGGGWQWSLPVGNGYSIQPMPPDSGQDGRH